MNAAAKAQHDLEERFYRLMYELGLYNSAMDTYNLACMKPTNYGYEGRLYLEPGLSFAELQKRVGIVQENMNCLWICHCHMMQSLGHPSTKQ